MRRQNIQLLLFVTKVLTCVVLSGPVFAAPHDESPNDGHIEEKTTITDPSVRATEVPHVDPMSIQTHYYPFKESISVRTGALLDVAKLTDGGLHFMGGVQYLAHGNYSPQWEFGIDFSGQGLGYFHSALRFIQNARNSYRPYTKLGLNLRLDGGEKLATFLDHKNLFAKASIGFEDLLKDATSIRMEIDLNAGFNDTYVLFTFGYSFAF